MASIYLISKGFFTDVTTEVMPATAIGRGWDVEVADLNSDGALDLALGGWGTQARLLLGTVKQPVSLDRKMKFRARVKLKANQRIVTQGLRSIDLSGRAIQRPLAL